VELNNRIGYCICLSGNHQDYGFTTSTDLSSWIQEDRAHPQHNPGDWAWSLQNLIQPQIWTH